MRKILFAVLAVWMLFLEVGPVSADPDQKQISPIREHSLPFRPGEKLTYEISWSNLVQAGTAVLEVGKAETSAGTPAYRCVSTAKSSGFLSRFYKVSDTVISVIDGHTLSSLSFRLDQNHGKRHKQREMLFNHEKGIVSVVSNGQHSTFAIPEDVQDPLSSLYSVRTRKDFMVDKPIILNVHEDGKTWAVEVQTLGREKIKTVLGEFNTIKLKTYPRYEGVFQNKGEIFIWLTDDARKIPVLMKSTISIGSIVSTLVDMKTGEEQK